MAKTGGGAATDTAMHHNYHHHCQDWPHPSEQGFLTKERLLLSQICDFLLKNNKILHFNENILKYVLVFLRSELVVHFLSAASD